MCDMRDMCDMCGKCDIHDKCDIRDMRDMRDMRGHAGQESQSQAVACMDASYGLTFWPNADRLQVAR